MENTGRNAELTLQEHPSWEVGAKTEGRSKLFQVSQIKMILAFSETLDFYDVGNELLPGNLGLICQYSSEYGRERELGAGHLGNSLGWGQDPWSGVSPLLPHLSPRFLFCRRSSEDGCK